QVDMRAGRPGVCSDGAQGYSDHAGRRRRDQLLPRQDLPARFSALPPVRHGEVHTHRDRNVALPGGAEAAACRCPSSHARASAAATPSTMVVSSAPLEPALSPPYVMKKFTPIAIATPPCAVVPSPKLGGDPARRSARLP